MKLFKNLFHVTLYTNDIDKSLEFYAKLGIELLFNVSVKPGDKPWNFYLRIAHEQYLEIQTVRGAAPAPYLMPERVMRHPDQSLWHFALQTENLAETIRALQAQGITVWKDPARRTMVNDISEVNRGEEGCMIAWVIDPDGNPIEMMEQVGQTMLRQYDYLD